MSRSTDGKEASEIEIPAGRLPRGRHGLSREVVVRSQRERIIRALCDTMSENGYAATSIAHILKRAGVSRETFYEQFRSKEDCFEAGYNWAVEQMTERISAGIQLVAGTTVEKFDQFLELYFDTLVEDPPRSKVFLVEVFAAGPKLIGMRAERQTVFVGIVVDLLQAKTAEQRFACQTLVSAVSAMVTFAVATNDIDSLSTLRKPILEMVSRAGDLYGTGISAAV